MHHCLCGEKEVYESCKHMEGRCVSVSSSTTFTPLFPLSFLPLEASNLHYDKMCIGEGKDGMQIQFFY